MPKVSIKRKRCKICNRKIKLVDTVIKPCRCKQSLCLKHSSPWNHSCKIVTNSMLIKRHKAELSKRLVKCNVSTVYNKL